MKKKRPELPPLVVRFTAREQAQNDEDDCVCVCRERLGLLAAFDGCGGMGGRKYRLLGNLTSAYLGSHLYADSLKRYFEEQLASLQISGIPEGWENELEAMLRLNALIYKRELLDREPSGVVGSMARTLPSTAAIAAIEPEKRLCHFYWAGDSRGYVLSREGLRQITKDDLVGSPDAFENIRSDAAMTNFLCVDRPFALHGRGVSLPDACAVLVATDGAFGCLPSPMHFERLLLEALAAAKSMALWQEAITERLRPVASDDVTLLIKPVGFSSFHALQSAHAPRLAALKKRYPIAETTDEETLRALWRRYEAELPSYE